MIRETGVGFNFPRQSRLRERREYLTVQRTGKRFFTQSFIVIIARGNGPAVRIGITASRKVGNAVRRNIWKRRIREAFRHMRRDVEGKLDLVVIVRTGVEPPSNEEAQRELRSVFRRHRREERRNGANS